MIGPAEIFRGKILIVDDQAANVALLERMLRGAGYGSITSTMDSSQVSELHLLNRYDLILLDLHMPGMDGFQVMENLKEIESGGYLPVLVVTAQPEHKLRALRAGARDFVSKPFDLAEVLLRVHNLLEVRLLHQETRILYERIQEEQKVSERLLRGLLPRPVAESLEERPEADTAGINGLVAESYAEMTVLFADVLEFTKFSEGASAEVLRGVLDDVSDRFDVGVGEAGIQRARTIGDAYLASVGLTDAVAAHTVRVAHKALDLIDAADRFNAHSRLQVRLRIGMDAAGS
jgi:adenylate cyclase